MPSPFDPEEPNSQIENWRVFTCRVDVAATQGGILAPTKINRLHAYSAWHGATKSCIAKLLPGTRTLGMRAMTDPLETRPSTRATSQNFFALGHTVRA